MKASEFLKTLPEKPGPDREKLILEAVQLGNYVPIEWNDIVVSSNGHTGTISVMADCLKIGEPTDYIRVSVSAFTEQKIADFLNLSLSTRKIEDLIYNQATVRLTPCILNADATMGDTSRMVLYNQKIEQKLAGRNGLVSTVGKNWVLSNRLLEKKDISINYGFHDPEASPNHWVWQTLGGAHNIQHTDYSQVVRLVQRKMVVDGIEQDIFEIMQDPILSILVSDEGPLKITRIPNIPLEQNRDTFKTFQYPWLDPNIPLGERCVLFSKNEMEQGVCETPLGSNTSSRIKEYLKPCYRRATGKLLGLTSANWCSAAVCFSALECLLPYNGSTEVIPHGYYCSGQEMEESAKEVDSWRDVELVKNGSWKPVIGDVVIIDRDDPNKKGDEWSRHVVRLISFDETNGNLETIGGNEDSHWRISKRNINDNNSSGPNRKIIGFIEYPRN